MVCNQCGKENKEGSKFCANCGTLLEPMHITESQTKKEETILQKLNITRD